MIKKGFTLIELLVVVAVLALLASIVFSNLGGAREGARISNALSFQSQIHSLLGSDLVGWWNFNEGSGTTARDISGYDNHGTIVGATYVDGVPGTGGTALEFNGSSDYVEVKNMPQLESAMTISLWIHPYIFEQEQRRFLVYGNSSHSFFIHHTRSFSKNTSIYLYNEDNEVSQVSIGQLPENDWHFITFTYDSAEEQHIGYVNGRFVNSNTLTGKIREYTGDLYIGRYINYFDGIIDDVRIYSRALTASEVSTLYAQTKNKYLVEK